MANPAASNASSGSYSNAHGSSADQANLQLYKSWGSQAAAAATFKLDGSFIIAFVWEGQLKVATRRRMNSEQVSR